MASFLIHIHLSLLSFTLVAASQSLVLQSVLKLGSFPVLFLCSFCARNLLILKPGKGTTLPQHQQRLECPLDFNTIFLRVLPDTQNDSLGVVPEGH